MEYMTLINTGSCSSNLFMKDVDNMMPFSQTSPWNFAAQNGIVKRTTQPIITGSSVLGLKYDGGVVICSDTLGSYGSMARFFDLHRVVKVNDQIVIGAGGDIADFQYMSGIIERMIIEEDCHNDGFNFKPKSLHCWLTRTLYNRRSKLDPLWNVYLVGGMQDGEPFLGMVDKIGTAFECEHIATGFGAYFGMPLLREAVEKNPKMSEQEAISILKHCIRILYYRDARSFPKFTLGIVNKDGVRIEGPVEIDSDWKLVVAGADIR